MAAQVIVRSILLHFLFPNAHRCVGYDVEIMTLQLLMHAKARGSGESIRTVDILTSFH